MRHWFEFNTNYEQFSDNFYSRDENDEYFFGIPKSRKIEVYLLTLAEDLYEYLAEESEGFKLIATKELHINWGRGFESRYR